MPNQIPMLPENLRYGRSGSVTVGVGGSAFVTGEVSTGSGGGGGTATVGVGTGGGGSAETGGALTVEVAPETCSVTCVVALVAVVVAACTPELPDDTA